MKSLIKRLALVACLGIAVALCVGLAPTASAQAAETEYTATVNFYASEDDTEPVATYTYTYTDAADRPTFGEVTDKFFSDYPGYADEQYWIEKNITDLKSMWSTGTETEITLYGPTVSTKFTMYSTKTRTGKVGGTNKDSVYDLHPVVLTEQTYKVVDADDQSYEFGTVTAIVGSNFLTVMNDALESGSLAIDKPGYELAHYAWGGYPDNKLGSLTYVSPKQDTVLVYFTKKEGVSVVTFDYNDGATSLQVEVADDGTVARPEDPTRDGYTFGGWYTDEACTIEYDFSTPVTGDIILYAKWTAVKPVTHTVTFWDGLESTEDLVVEVVDGQTVERPDDPTCVGWTFVGWFSDIYLTQEYDFSTPVTGDLILYAKWEESTDPGYTPDGDGTPDTDEQPTTPSESESTDATGTTEQKVPETGDVTMAVAGVGALGTALAGVSGFLKRRR